MARLTQILGRITLAASALGLYACGSASVPAPGTNGHSGEWMQGYRVPDQAARIQALRQAHGELVDASSEGKSCSIDSDCDSPLRCLEAMCEWPQAMTGYADAYSPVVVIETSKGTRRFFVELAEDDAERARGLMHRRSMQQEFGMLFVFERDRMQSFWMRNTLIPLDIIFIRADGVVDSIVENAEPLSETPRPSTGPAKYVLELEGGAAQFYGIAPGQKVQFVHIDG